MNFKFNPSWIWLWLDRPGLEPTFYRTRGEHANHYTTDAVIYVYSIRSLLALIILIFSFLCSVL